MRTLYLVLALVVSTSAAFAQSLPGTTDRFFITSDGVRLHYFEAGQRNRHTLVLIPGWTMPAWIFAPQIRAFSPNYHVIAFDPRGQGDSDIPDTGYDQGRRGQDIADLLKSLGPQRVTLVAWSLGVLDSLAYVHSSGDAKIAGMVLIDNSVGENPPPSPEPPSSSRHPRLTHAQYMRAFVIAMFATRQLPAYINQLTASTLRLPEIDARALLEYPVPRSYWREAIMSTNTPIFYIVRPHLAGQAQNLLADRPNTQIAIFHRAGHALFVDSVTHFNTLVANFLQDRVWPP
jgi:non-heme chloroperoxidase